MVFLTGIWIPQKLPTSSLANIKGWSTLWVQSGCRHVGHEEEKQKLLKTNLGRDKSLGIGVWAKQRWGQTYLKLNNKPLFICYLFVGWMPEPTRQTKLLKDGEHFWVRCHMQLCFGFPNYVGFGKCNSKQRPAQLVSVAVDVFGFSGIFIYTYINYIDSWLCHNL